MTTTDLIDLLQKSETGTSGRSREVRIYKRDENGELVNVLKESDIIEILSLGDGCAGAELSLVISK